MNDPQKPHDQTSAEIEYLVSAFMPDTIKYMKFFRNVAVILLGWFASPLEVFIRREFGVRYLTWSFLFIGYATIEFWAFVAPSMLELAPSLLMHVLGIVFLGFGVYHRIRITMKYWRGQEWYSYSFGISYLDYLALGFLKDDWTLYRVTEPIIALLVGIGLWWIDPVLSLWITGTSLALMVKNNLLYEAHRHALLDRIDAHILAKHYNDAVQGKPKQETAGFSVASSISKVLVEDFDVAETVDEAMNNEPEPDIMHLIEPESPDFSDTVNEVFSSESVLNESSN